MGGQMKEVERERVSEVECGTESGRERECV